MTVNNQNFFEKLADQILSYKKPIGVALLVFVVLGLAYGIYDHQSYKKRQEASAELYKLIGTQKEKLGEFFEKPENVDAVTNFAKKYENSPSAKEVVLELAKFLHEKSMFKEALEVLNLVPSKSQSTFLDQLYIYRKALAKIQLEQYQEALSDLEQLAKDTKSFLYTQSSLQKALCLEKLGRKDEARITLEILANDHADTESGRAAAKYLRTLDMGV